VWSCTSPQETVLERSGIFVEIWEQLYCMRLKVVRNIRFMRHSFFNLCSYLCTCIRSLCIHYRDFLYEFTICKIELFLYNGGAVLKSRLENGLSRILFPCRLSVPSCRWKVVYSPAYPSQISDIAVTIIRRYVFLGAFK
jgi:hypothetical protein